GMNGCEVVVQVLIAEAQLSCGEPAFRQKLLCFSTQRIYAVPPQSVAVVGTDGTYASSKQTRQWKTGFFRERVPQGHIDCCSRKGRNTADAHDVESPLRNLKALKG